MISIKQLLEPFRPSLLSAYKELTISSIPIIEDVNSHLNSTQGKQLRPLMTILTGLCCGLDDTLAADHPVFAAAAAIETLHASTLMHDDVIDNADIRRGVPSVRKQWGNKAAVLVGDFYLARIMQTFNKIDNKAVTSIIGDTVAQMSEGELLQLQHNGIYTDDNNTYLTIIEKKTAVFMAACCEVGAVFATGDERLRQHARRFGLNLGMAFQIRDDIIDYMPATVTGKPQGNDLCEGKCTLPLIHALKNSDDDTKKNILSLLKEKPLSDTNLKRLMDTVTHGGYLASAARVHDEYLECALEALQALPDNKYRAALAALTDNPITL